jgi:hypothetical protein
MFSRPKGSLSRILLVACAVGLGSSSLYGQSSTQPQPRPWPRPFPRSTFSWGTRIWRRMARSHPAERMARPVPIPIPRWTTARSLSVSYYFNKYVGGQVEIGIHPDGNNDGASSYSAGIIARYPTDEGVTPFGHALVGRGAARRPELRTARNIYHVYTGARRSPSAAVWITVCRSSTITSPCGSSRRTTNTGTPRSARRRYRRTRQPEQCAPEHRHRVEVRQHRSAAACHLQLLGEPVGRLPG